MCEGISISPKTKTEKYCINHNRPTASVQSANGGEVLKYDRQDGLYICVSHMRKPKPRGLKPWLDSLSPTPIPPERLSPRQKHLAAVKLQISEIDKADKREREKKARQKKYGHPTR